MPDSCLFDLVDDFVIQRVASFLPPPTRLRFSLLSKRFHAAAWFYSPTVAFQQLTQRWAMRAYIILFHAPPVLTQEQLENEHYSESEITVNHDPSSQIVPDIIRLTLDKDSQSHLSSHSQYPPHLPIHPVIDPNTTTTTHPLHMHLHALPSKRTGTNKDVFPTENPVSVSSFTCSPKGEFVALIVDYVESFVFYYDLWLWNVRTNHMSKVMIGRKGSRVRLPEFSPDGAYILLYGCALMHPSFDKTFMLFDLHAPLLVPIHAMNLGTTADVTAFAFNKPKFVIANAHSVIYLVDIISGHLDPLHPMIPKDTATSLVGVRFAPHQHSLVALYAAVKNGDHDRVLRFDCDRMRLISARSFSPFMFPNFSTVHEMSVSDDLTLLLLSVTENTYTMYTAEGFRPTLCMQIWDLDTGSRIYACNRGRIVHPRLPCSCRFLAHTSHRDPDNNNTTQLHSVLVLSLHRARKGNLFFMEKLNLLLHTVHVDTVQLISNSSKRLAKDSQVIPLVDTWDHFPSFSQNMPLTRNGKWCVTVTNKEPSKYDIDPSTFLISIRNII